MKRLMSQNVAYIIILIVLLGGQLYYVGSVYKKEQEVLAYNKAKIAEKIKYKHQLEVYLNELPEIERQIQSAYAQKEALKNTMIFANSQTKAMMILHGYAQANQLVDSHLVEVEDEVDEESQIEEAQTEEALDDVRKEKIEEEMIKKNYRLSFKSKYEDAKKFVENLNAAHQVIQLESIQMDNSIQKTEDEGTLKILKSYFGEDLSNVVDVQLDFTLYISEIQEHEVYEGNLSIGDESQKPFAMCYEGNRKCFTDSYEISQFEIDLQDILIAGDTYKIVGPGNIYLGIVSQSNVYIKMDLNDEGYTLKIKDENGVQQEKTYKGITHNPLLEITSTMRQVQSIMPHVYIYINNTGTDKMKVEAEGSLLENMHIYDQNQREIQKGEYNEKIAYI